jgi:hypothetical protein
MAPHTSNLDDTLYPTPDSWASHPIHPRIGSIAVDDATFALPVLEWDTVAALIRTNAHRRTGRRETIVVGRAVDTVTAEVGIRAVVYRAGVARLAE